MIKNHAMYDMIDLETNIFQLAWPQIAQKAKHLKSGA